MFGVRIIDNNWKVGRVGGWFDIAGIAAPQNNVWYHIRIDFKCSIGGYDGLDQYDFNVHINGVEYGDYDFLGNQDAIGVVYMTTGAVFPNYKFYIDAVGYSWNDVYEVGNNKHEGLLLTFDPNDLDYMLLGYDGQHTEIYGDFVLPLDGGEHSITVAGEHDGDLYQSGSLSYSIINMLINSPTSIEYDEPDPGYYPGTYGFESDTHNTNGVAVSMIDEWTGNWGSYLRIHTNDGPLYGHNKYLRISDSQSGGKTTGVHNFDNPQSSGTIEFWLLMSGSGSTGSTNRYNEIHFRKSDNTIAFRAQLKMLEGGHVSGDRADVAYYDGNSWVGFADGEDLTWYHNRIDFDCTSGTKGKYSWYIYEADGTLLGSIIDIDFEYAMITLDEIYFTSTTSHYRGNSFWDAFGFSWNDLYRVGDNMDEGLLLTFDPNDLDYMELLYDSDSTEIFGDFVLPWDEGSHIVQISAEGNGQLYQTSPLSYSIEKIITIESPLEGNYFPTGGHYYGSYSFESDTNGEDPSGWLVKETGGEISVISGFNGHSKIVQMFRTTSTGTMKISNFFSDREYGTLEFYVAPYILENYDIILSHGNPDTGTLVLRFDQDGTIKYFDGSWHQIDENDNFQYSKYIKSPYYYHWFHVKIDFTCDTIIQDGWWDLEIDGKSIGTGYEFNGATPHLSQIDFDIPDDNGLLFVDAIGFSWDSQYSEGNNLEEGLYIEFTSSKSLTWYGYSIENAPPITITSGNLITMPAYGEHTIQIFGEDSYGNEYTSEVRSFFNYYFDESDEVTINRIFFQR
ncbi:hypothetical protein LCGC14_1474920 [marine sediment metagenome]|uniref:Uncharacterized protein n=1 Tax=marine sediment metagenome TaxID=412755 RepID=A0A0F9JX66_9ZZZZ